MPFRQQALVRMAAIACHSCETACLRIAKKLHKPVIPACLESECCYETITYNIRIGAYVIRFLIPKHPDKGDSLLPLLRFLSVSSAVNAFSFCFCHSLSALNF